MTIETWSETVGEKPHRVTVFERLDKGMTVFMRWYIGGVAKHERSSVGTIRDARGRTMRRKQEQALAEALAKVEELKGGKDRKVKDGPLTLREGARQAWSDRGCYPLDPEKDAWTKDARGYYEGAVKLLGGDAVRFQDITPGMIRAVWRQMEKAGAGNDKATKTLAVFFTVARWLEGEFQDQRFPRPPKGWRSELKDHWHKKGHATEPFRPRHTDEEIALLFKHREKGDPRIALALVVGAELRGGQVTRAMRSQLDLEAGRLTIPGKSRRKRIPPLVLNRLELAELTAAMTDGYLSDAETAYRGGDIADYALFPAGRLRKGKAIADRCQEPMHPTSIAGLFHDLEAAAGVEKVPGRAWHGMRRGFSDYYARLLTSGKITDPRLLDQLQGWAPGSLMRERVYQDQASDELQGGAADARLFRPGME